jgi:sensor domain CHASE-containing protein
MHLQKKILSVFFAAILFYGTAEYAIQKWILYPSFLKLENQQAIRNLECCQRTLEREAEHLSLICFDWSAWDDTGLFIRGQKDDYIKQNLMDETFDQQKFNVVCFLDTHNKLIWEKCIKFVDGEQLVETTIKEFSAEMLPQQTFLLEHKTPEDFVAGLMVTEAGPMLVTSRPITNAKNTPPIYGTIIIGRLINDKTMALLSEQIQVDFEWWSLSSEKTRQTLQPYLSRLTEENPIRLERSDDKNVVAAYKTMPGLNSKQILLIKSFAKQEITAEGRKVTQMAFILSLAAAGIIFAALFVFFETSVPRFIRRYQHKS